VKKNPVAKDLRTPKYRQRKVESKKKYNRKKKHIKDEQRFSKQNNRK